MLKKRTILSFSYIFIVSLLFVYSILGTSKPAKVSCKDALILLLYPEVTKQVDAYYKEYISNGPTVAPYSIEIIDLYHTPHQSGAYHYTIVLETRPYVGAHVDVGLDKITITFSLDGIETVQFEHLESESLPPWLTHHIIKPLP